MRTIQTLMLLIASWAAGLAAYAGALVGLRGEILPLDTWMVIGPVTLAAWLLASVLVSLPVLRQLALRRSDGSRSAPLAAAGAALAILPVWLTLGFWYGWHPRHFLIQEAGLLGLLYGTSGLILGLSLARMLRLS
jgi:hypothetical protein